MKEIIIIGIGLISFTCLVFTSSKRIDNEIIEIRKEKEKIEKIIIDDSVCYKYKNSISCLKKEEGK